MLPSVLLINNDTALWKVKESNSLNNYSTDASLILAITFTEGDDTSPRQGK